MVDKAKALDLEDPLFRFRREFELPNRGALTKAISLPPVSNHSSYEEIVYLCSNSLGLQPKRTKTNLEFVLQQWGNLGVVSHYAGDYPTEQSDTEPIKLLAECILGAEYDEVAMMETLTANIHTLLIAFYRPTPTKSCILIEKGAFPSDYYAVESQIALNGHDPTECIIELDLRPSDYLSTKEIISVIEANADRLALIWLPGVQYFTGELLDIKEITDAGHRFAKCPVGWDLAHAVGNVPLRLHDWNVDCAAWCAYKYLCGSPGGVGGLFVHTRHHLDEGSYAPVHGFTDGQVHGPRLTGWWGHQFSTRFKMDKQMRLERGALAYCRSCPSMLLNSAMLSGLKIFQEAGGMEIIREKSIKLTGYLETLLTSGEFGLPPDVLSVMTPRDPLRRGAQLSLEVNVDVDELHEYLIANGVVCDVRRPNCIRMAPAPLYTSFEDVFRAAKFVHKAVCDLLHNKELSRSNGFVK